MLNVKPNFNLPTSKVNVQVYKVGATSHMWDGVIMKSRKWHFRQVPYHTHFTYTQTSNQAIRDQKPLKKVQIIPKPKKLQKKFEKFHKNMCKKGIWLPQLLNLTMSSLWAEELQPRTKI